MILVVGDVLLDVFILSELQAAEQGSGLLFRPGGSAANTAAWLACRDVPATFVGCVGADAVGDMLVRELHSHGCATVVRVVPEDESGGVAVQVAADGERTMRSSRGANQALSPGDIAGAGDRSPRFVHLTGYALLCPAGLALLAAAGKVARRSAGLLSFDPSSPGVINRFGAEQLRSAMRDAGVGLVVPNAEEARLLSRQDDIIQAAARLAGEFGRCVVTDGPRGAFAVDGRTGHHIPTDPVAAVDTTGAGDGFNAGLLTGLYRGAELTAACLLAHELAAAVVSRYGGRPPLEAKPSDAR